MKASEYAVFSQELYFKESLNAIEKFDPGESGLTRKIAETLHHPSALSRERIATKIAQRFFKSHCGEPEAFIRLVRKLGHESDRLDLVYWRTAKTDQLIMHIAGDIFYPYFVLGTYPSGFDEHAFRIANTGNLFDADKLITADFVHHYAKAAWGFDTHRVLTLSLRILTQCGILDSVNVDVDGKSTPGYFPRRHAVSPDVFAFCIAEEVLCERTCSVDRAETCTASKIFLLSRLEVRSILKELQKKKIIEQTDSSGGKYFRFLVTDLNGLVELLKTK